MSDVSEQNKRGLELIRFGLNIGVYGMPTDSKKPAEQNKADIELIYRCMQAGMYEL